MATKFGLGTQIESPTGLNLMSFVCVVPVCVQTAAVSVFGGGSWEKYKAKASLTLDVDWTTTTDVYFDWCFWMAVVGGGLTLLSAIFYLIYDCCVDRLSK